MEKEYLAVYSEKCLRCSHFVEGAQRTYTKCHFSKGNSYCPAKEVRVVIAGRMKYLKKKLESARHACNAEMESEVWIEVAKQSEAFKRRFYQILEES